MTAATISERLRTARADAGITQRELAERANISERQVQRLESGECPAFRVSTLERLCPALRVTAEYLVGR